MLGWRSQPMDAETSEAIGGLGERIDLMRSEMHGQIGGLRSEMHELIGELRSEMNGQIDGLRSEMHEQVDALQIEMRTRGVDLRGRMQAIAADLRTEFRQDLRDGFGENRGHTEVLFKSLRDDIRIVAEGLANVVAKLDSLRS